jgi:hypothetical protein
MNRSSPTIAVPLLCSFVVAALSLVAAETSPARPVFKVAANGEFAFDTGILRGTLRAGGKSLGLSSVAHLPTGRRLDRGNGLFSHYRVFSKGVRYGAGAWDWPSTARLLDDGSVEVNWPTATKRPFAMKAVYRWITSSILELDTIVEPQTDLSGFEVFLASYFDEVFTNACAFVQESPASGGKAGLLPARQSFGEWLMFPRDSDVVPLIQDGRWRLEPNPVNWTLMPRLERPIGMRRDPKSGLTAILSTSAHDGFAVAMPHQAEGHYSVYLSLFGRDVKAGETARAKARVVIVEAEEDRLLKLCEDFAR